MPLCGSSFCGCALVSAPATAGEIDGAFPTIDVAGNGTGASPWNLTLNDEWAASVADSPRGVLDYVKNSSTNTDAIGTSYTRLNLMDVTWTAEAGRLYRLTGHAILQPSTTTWRSLALAGTTGPSFISISKLYGPAVDGQTVEVSGLFTGTGVQEVALYAAVDSGTVNHRPTANSPSFIMVEDIGSV